MKCVNTLFEIFCFFDVQFYCNILNYGFIDDFRLLQRHNKRPDAIQTFDLLSKLELWNGNSGGIHETPTQHNNDLKNQLNQVTDELKQLKMQMTSPTPPNDNSVNNIPDTIVSFESSELHANLIHQAINHSMETNHVDEQVSSTNANGYFNETEEKDRQIRILTNRLSASDKEASELRKEVQRLRDIIKQRNGLH